MAAKLTPNGIQFGDGTTLISKRGVIPYGASMVFYQSAAPTGWTKQTSYNNYALRVVGSGVNGGGVGGSQPFTTVCSPTFSYAGNLATNTSTGFYGLSTPQIPSHIHGGAGFQYSANGINYNPNGTFNSWNGGDVARPAPGAPGGWSFSYPAHGLTGAYFNSHNHPVSASANISTPVSLGVRYIDVLVCSFNG